MTVGTLRSTGPAWSYKRGATLGELTAFWGQIAAMERKERVGASAWLAAVVHERVYQVFMCGRLAGMCFVADLPDRREMAFTKTEWLVSKHPIAFARAIPGLLRDLARLERGRDGKPMYMHVPEGDDRSAAWFVRAGCRLTARGLLCPVAKKKGARRRRRRR